MVQLELMVYISSPIIMLIGWGIGAYLNHYHQGTLEFIGPGSGIINPPGWPLNMSQTFFWECLQLVLAMGAFSVYDNDYNEDFTHRTPIGILIPCVFAVVSLWLLAYYIDRKNRQNHLPYSIAVWLLYVVLAYAVLGLFYADFTNASDDVSSAPIWLWLFTVFGKTMDLLWIYKARKVL